MTKRHATEEAVNIMLAAGLQPLEPFKGATATWKCVCRRCGLESTPQLNNVKRGAKCRHCSSKAKAEVKTAKYNAKIIKELGLVGLTVTEISNSNPGRVSGKCDRCGNSFSVRRDSALSGVSCRSCTNATKSLRVGKNDLASQFPTIASQANGWDPSMVSMHSSQLKSWKCNLGHVWQTRVENRTLKGTNCPYCSGNKILVGFNDLATTHPELASELLDTDATTISRGSSGKRTWKCPTFGHTYISTVSHRIEGKGCPYCSGNKILVGFNDLATTHPELASELVDIDPQTVTKGMNRRLSWSCSLGHRFIAFPGNRIKGEGCPYCAGRKILVGFNDLSTTHTAIAAEAHGWDPTKVGRGHSTELPWRCAKAGHVWTVSPNQRTSHKTSCPYCTGRLAVTGESDIATTHPELIPEVDGWDPTSVKFGSKRRLSWLCPLGHSYRMTPANRTMNGQGCPYCSSTRVLAGFNDLKTRFPEIASEADGWDPTTVFGKSNARRAFRCSDGHTWTARIADRTTKDAGCPSCAKTGFDPNEPGFIYFLRHDLLGLYQIGITNNPPRRLQQHKSRGWDVIEVQGPMDGQATRDLETSILKELRRHGATFANRASYSRFDGWSESWTQASFESSTLRKLKELVDEDRG